MTSLLRTILDPYDAVPADLRNADSEFAELALLAGDFEAAELHAAMAARREPRFDPFLRAIRATITSPACQARALRELCGLSAVKAAGQLGITPDALYRREIGRAAVRAETLLALRFLLGQKSVEPVSIPGPEAGGLEHGG